MKLSASIIAAAALLGASAASAATVTFTGPNRAGPSGTTSGDIAVGYVASASAYDSLGFNSIPATVTQTAAGLGVNSQAYGFPDGNPNQIDGRPVTTGEALTITFDYAVDLDSFTLGLFNPGIDDYTIYINGALAGVGATATNGGFEDVTSFTIQANGVLFLDGLGAGNDAFTLASFSVSSVPLPAGAGLLAGALGLLALARRRKAA